MTDNDLLRLENIGVRLGGRQILSGVSFAVAPGQFTGLIGPNGAGKTTLLRVILGLTPPTEGRVLLNGSPKTRHGGGLIGYVPQKLAIDQDMPLRARDVVGLGIDGNKLGFPLPSASRRQRITKALEAVGAESYADARIGELSGGEQQRVLIAQALIGRPKLLLLDEPLANLDLRSEQGIVSVLARLAHEQGIAVLISAHDLNPLLREIDTVVYVAAGRAAAGRADEIIQSDVLSALYGSRVDVLHVNGRVLVIAGDEQQEVQAHHPAETGVVVGMDRT
ncbi:metal ABC transporter ATP-binding protein [Trebonia sp.]|uniref:metal ABC transporter ATP-binding protein n=1 Tax=Trebonia sp. TaxID=2767075 RepID=UPI003CC5AE2D